MDGRWIMAASPGWRRDRSIGAGFAGRRLSSASWRRGGNFAPGTARGEATAFSLARPSASPSARRRRSLPGGSARRGVGVASGEFRPGPRKGCRPKGRDPQPVPAGTRSEASMPMPARLLARQGSPVAQRCASAAVIPALGIAAGIVTLVVTVDAATSAAGREKEIVRSPAVPEARRRALARVRTGHGARGPGARRASRQLAPGARSVIMCTGSHRSE